MKAMMFSHEMIKPWISPTPNRNGVAVLVSSILFFEGTECVWSAFGVVATPLEQQTFDAFCPNDLPVCNTLLFFDSFDCAKLSDGTDKMTFKLLVALLVVLLHVNLDIAD